MSTAATLATEPPDVQDREATAAPRGRRTAPNALAPYGQDEHIARNNAVAFIKRALADGQWHSRKSLEREFNSPEIGCRAYINEIKSASEQAQRYTASAEEEGYPTAIAQGQRIIWTSIAALVWAGILHQKGQDTHAAYRLAADQLDRPEPQPANSAARACYSPTKQSTP